jgi:uncharacterized protein (UPF0548 family)
MRSGEKRTTTSVDRSVRKTKSWQCFQNRRHQLSSWRMKEGRSDAFSDRACTGECANMNVLSFESSGVVAMRRKDRQW